MGSSKGPVPSEQRLTGRHSEALARLGMQWNAPMGVMDPRAAQPDSWSYFLRADEWRKRAKLLNRAAPIFDHVRSSHSARRCRRCSQNPGTFFVSMSCGAEHDDVSSFLAQDRESSRIAY
jgi:hypothetical protein